MARRAWNFAKQRTWVLGLCSKYSDGWKKVLNLKKRRYFTREVNSNSIYVQLMGMVTMVLTSYNHQKHHKRISKSNIWLSLLARPWHALTRGAKAWLTHIDINGWSIGGALVRPPHELVNVQCNFLATEMPSTAFRSLRKHLWFSMLFIPK